MQVCMEPKSSAEMINRETCPVRIDITDRGFPEGIPVLRWHERALADSPWIRRRFGHFVLIDPWDEELFDIAYGTQGIEALEGKIAKFHEQVPQLSAVREPRPKPPAADRSEVLPEKFRTGPLWLPFMTCYELSFDHWLQVIDVIADRDKVAPGVSNATIHALGDLVTSAQAPYTLVQCHNISMCASAIARRRVGENPPTPSSDGWNVQQRAACALIHIAKLSIRPEAPDFFDQVRSWWTTHHDDPEFRIEWSANPDLKYAFLREGRGAGS